MSRLDRGGWSFPGVSGGGLRGVDGDWRQCARPVAAGGHLCLWTQALHPTEEEQEDEDRLQRVTQLFFTSFMSHFLIV